MLAGLICAQSCLLLLQAMALLLCATCYFISGKTNLCLKYPLKRLSSCKPRSSIHFMCLLSCRCFYLLFINSSSWATRFSLFLVNARFDLCFLLWNRAFGSVIVWLFSCQHSLLFLFCTASVLSESASTVTTLLPPGTWVRSWNMQVNKICSILFSICLCQPAHTRCRFTMVGLLAGWCSQITTNDSWLMNHLPPTFSRLFV